MNNNHGKKPCNGANFVMFRWITPQSYNFVTQCCSFGSVAYYEVDKKTGYYLTIIVLHHLQSEYAVLLAFLYVFDVVVGQSNAPIQIGKFKRVINNNFQRKH